jgi:hypothetical protein
MNELPPLEGAKIDVEGRENVTALFGRGRSAAARVAPLSDDEILSLRKLIPQLFQMIEEWKKLRGSCPIARDALSD